MLEFESISTFEITGRGPAAVCKAPDGWDNDDIPALNGTQVLLDGVEVQIVGLEFQPIVKPRYIVNGNIGFLYRPV